MLNQKLKEQVAALKLEEKLELIELLEENTRAEKDEIMEAWVDESMRRLALYEAGKTQALDAEEVFASLRRK
jgi:putative addiction module component (TIGR02574 family)